MFVEIIIHNLISKGTELLIYLFMMERTKNVPNKEQRYVQFSFFRPFHQKTCNAVVYGSVQRLYGTTLIDHPSRPGSGFPKGS